MAKPKKVIKTEVKTVVKTEAPAPTPTPVATGKLYKMAIKQPNLRKPHTKAAWAHLAKFVSVKTVTMDQMIEAMAGHKWTGTTTKQLEEAIDHTCFPGYAVRSKWIMEVE